MQMLDVSHIGRIDAGVLQLQPHHIERQHSPQQRRTPGSNPAHSGKIAQSGKLKNSLAHADNTDQDEQGKQKPDVTTVLE